MAVFGDIREYQYIGRQQRIQVIGAGITAHGSGLLARQAQSVASGRQPLLGTAGRQSLRVATLPSMTQTLKLNRLNPGLVAGLTASPA